MTQTVFGRTPDGSGIDLYTLRDGGLQARITTYGARLVSLEVPDRNGRVADIVLGYDTAAEYAAETKGYFGATVGRYANRIAAGAFVLDGKRYQLPKNGRGVTSLHGGTCGFDKHLWRARAIADGAEMELISEDGDQGYPGTLTTRVRYTLAESALTIEYFATTDRTTVVNLTNHSYFNLAGEGQGDILGHTLSIAADRYTPVNADLIPTGEVASVQDTPLDFRRPAVIGARIDADHEQLRIAQGYDQNFVLNGSPGELKEAARLVEPKSGRVLTAATTEPGMQFYSGNFLDGTVPGKHGHRYAKRSALCLETQHFPDSPNHPNFPTTELKPGEQFHSVTVYRFSTD